jgi:2-iminobutanoate/2-iminopropanoate deaminase
MKEIVSGENVPKPAGAYSPAIVVNDLIFIAGQTPYDPRTGTLAQSIEEQTRQVLEKIKVILVTIGSSLEQVVRTDVYLSDLSLFEGMNSVYKTYFEEGSYPARTTVGVNLAGFLVEISCIAHRQA